VTKSSAEDAPSGVGVERDSGAGDSLRIIVTGASGNVGAGVLRAIARELPRAQVVGVCRRPPTNGAPYGSVAWFGVDLGARDAVIKLQAAMRGADVIVHLALAVQPVRDDEQLYKANVIGSDNVLRAAAAAGVPHLVYASSLGAYAPAEGRPVSEDWPTTGQRRSSYSLHKVAVERLLDDFEGEHPAVAVARIRPTVVVQREAAWLMRTLYLGPFVPRTAFELARRRRVPVLPLPAGLRLQFVHADDVGDAVVSIIRRRARGAFNIAADVLDAHDLAAVVGARTVAVRPVLVEKVVLALSALRVVAVTPGWFDVATKSPLMDTRRAHDELQWTPRWSSAASAAELIGGLADEVVGGSAATGSGSNDAAPPPRTVQVTHDASLAAWALLTVHRAATGRRVSVVDAAAVATNLVAGTPIAIQRLRERRSDAVAVLAPVTVVAALAAGIRGGWPSVVGVAALSALAAVERRRMVARR
jgi:UDP-glucose 4-epimerase